MPQCKNSYLKWNSQTPIQMFIWNQKSVGPWEIPFCYLNLMWIIYHFINFNFGHLYASQPLCAFQLFAFVIIQAVRLNKLHWFFYWNQIKHWVKNLEHTFNMHYFLEKSDGILLLIDDLLEGLHAPLPGAGTSTELQSE